MENKFEYLMIDGRGQLPEPWSNYPTLTDYETVTIYRNGRNYLDALVGQQDGWWTAGVHMQIGGSGGGFNPGRKWGQFANRDNALLWALGWMLSSNKLQGAARQAVLDKIDSIRQLKLF
ncbi:MULTISPECIES: hypothetical protein [Bacteroides]|jgi:hypothetical protein|uniref:hypothetical protein n=1 Tax=Bacteroides TaxID=816 RepID=UPI001897033E|nr:MULTISPECIES: hypothetical protein [Bacteroides]MDD3228259.1 hypothetical protein [Oscillospiraceae bacterium]MBT9921340.1 hypothetical protein [Bacteroides uniformis]MDC2622305.1 hypothetical protein [Bacteroides ovatus]MDC2635371.1 hypothetical protein [Bacteroides ovatus]MDC2649734.1 hypothetical protein [Bacteroides ovatus]